MQTWMMGCCSCHHFYSINFWANRKFLQPCFLLSSDLLWCELQKCKKMTHVTFQFKFIWKSWPKVWLFSAILHIYFLVLLLSSICDFWHFLIVSWPLLILFFLVCQLLILFNFVHILSKLFSRVYVSILFLIAKRATRIHIYTIWIFAQKQRQL